MNKYTELEYKYKADNVTLLQFRELMNESSCKKSLDISSWDTYYTNLSDGPEAFIRHREAANPPELTIKRKSKKNNNWHRQEVDLQLMPEAEADVEAFCNLLGYTKNFKIYKSCFIYWYEHVNYVYYITYDEGMKELDRFIEVEVNKDSILGLEDPETVLARAEHQLGKLDIKPANRMKRSLFEIYRK